MLMTSSDSYDVTGCSVFKDHYPSYTHLAIGQDVIYKDACIQMFLEKPFEVRTLCVCICPFFIPSLLLAGLSGPSSTRCSRCFQFGFFIYLFFIGWDFFFSVLFVCLLGKRAWKIHLANQQVGERTQHK